MNSDELMKRLAEVTRLEFRALTNGQKSGWQGNGRGAVSVASLDSSSVLFTETGSWKTEEGRQIDFRNIYRWSDVDDGIRLEHLRFGPDQPIYLFDLRPVSMSQWISRSPHVCREDCYKADLVIGSSSIELTWRITGPEKDETIHYIYE